MAKSIPRIGEVSLDWRVFLYTGGCAVLVTLLSGLFPAFRASSAIPAGALSRGGRTQVSARHPVQWILVSSQVALAVCLLSGAGLLLRSFQALSQVSPGFDASHVLVFRVTGGYAETADIPKLRQSANRILDALRALPGVQAAASTMSLPGVPFQYPFEVASPDSALDPTRKMTAEARYVSDGYFDTMRIPSIAGRSCGQRSDGTDVVVNRSFAATYFAGSDPTGHHLVNVPNPFGSRGRNILGVVADARESGLNQEPAPTVYWCGLPLDPDRYYLLRTAGDPAQLASAVRQSLHSVEPARAAYDLSPLPVHLNGAFAMVRLRTSLLTLFAGTALLLACVGLYGTMTYFVTTKRREIGLRIALGGHRNEVGMRLAGRGFAAAVAGVIVGIGIAAWSTRFVSGMLYNVHANDPMAFFTAIAAMLAVALLASGIPATRATRLDPMQILREE